MNRMRTELVKAALMPAEISADSGYQSFQFGEDFVGFAGHFPGYPILPGILQILLAQMLAEQILGERLSFCSLERVKFSSQIRQGDQVDVHVSCREKSEFLHCTCELSLGETRAASFILVLGKETAS